jgi:hypothetical protein
MEDVCALPIPKERGIDVVIFLGLSVSGALLGSEGLI